MLSAFSITSCTWAHLYGEDERRGLGDAVVVAFSVGEPSRGSKAVEIAVSIGVGTAGATRLRFRGSTSGDELPPAVRCRRALISEIIGI